MALPQALEGTWEEIERHDEQHTDGSDTLRLLREVRGGAIFDGAPSE